MHALLAEPTVEQKQLINTILQGRLELNPPNYALGVEPADERPFWPNFQYVERRLYRQFNLNVREVLSTCPMLRGSGGNYGWIWSDHQFRDESRIGVTVAGMRHVDAPVAIEPIGLFLHMLTLMVAAELVFEPSPAEVVPVKLTTETAHELLKQLDQQLDLGPRAFDDVRELLRHEPGTWHSSATETEWTLSPFLRLYRDVETAERYVERVIDAYTPAQPDPEPLYPSSLALPEAIDYLNLVWHKHAGTPLIRIGRAEAAVKLALDCATADEFESRISALCTILGAIHLPDRGESKLMDLRAYLLERLGGEGSRAAEAIDDLRAAFDVRVWRQHAGTDARGARGMARLGISLPVDDWGAAWTHIQGRMVAALSALREELEAI
jgi:hypothetical protein